MRQLIFRSRYLWLLGTLCIGMIFPGLDTQAQRSVAAKTAATSLLVKQAAQLLPPSTIGFFVLDLKQLRQTGIKQLTNLFNLDRASPILDGLQPDVLVDNLLTQLYYTYINYNSYDPKPVQQQFPLVGLRDVEPWLGDYALIAVIYREPTGSPTAPATSESGDTYRARFEELVGRYELVALVESKDDNAMHTFVETAGQVSRNHEKFVTVPNSVSVANGGILYAARTLPFGYIPGFLVMGMSHALEMIQSVRSGAPSLAQSAPYTAELERLPDDSPLFVGWLNLAGFTPMLIDPPLDYDSSAPYQIRQFALYREVFGRAAIAAQLTENGGGRVDLTYSGKLPVDLPHMQPVIGKNQPYPIIAGELPADTVILLESRDPNLFYTYLRNLALTLTYRLNGPSTYSQALAGIALFESQINLHFQDLFTPMNGAFGIGIFDRPGRLSNPPFSVFFATQTASAGGAQEVTSWFTKLVSSSQRLIEELGYPGEAVVKMTSVDLNGTALNRVSSDIRFLNSVVLSFGDIDNLFLFGTDNSMEKFIYNRSNSHKLVGSNNWSPTFGSNPDLGNVYLYYNNEQMLLALRRYWIDINSYDRQNIELLSLLTDRIRAIRAALKVTPPGTLDLSVIIMPR